MATTTMKAHVYACAQCILKHAYVWACVSAFLVLMRLRLLPAAMRANWAMTMMPDAFVFYECIYTNTYLLLRTPISFVLCVSLHRLHLGEV